MIDNIVRCFCECCNDEDKCKAGGAAQCCFCVAFCYAKYKQNISGHRRRTYRFLNIILVLILTIVAVVLSALVLSTNSSSINQLNSIKENWQMGVFLNIQLSKQCPSDYEVLSNYEIPKTKRGCVCQADGELFDSECSDWQNLTGCYNIEPKSEIVLEKWAQRSNNSYLEVQICGLRSKLKFYDLLENKVTTKEDCNEMGYKVCQTQNPSNFYCVLQEEPCPIRDIKIQQNQLSDQEKELNGYSLIYDNGFYVYTSTTTESTPLVNMKIVKGKGVCFDDDIISLNPKLEEDYLLLTQQPEDCEIDNTYFQIAKCTEKELFSVNNVETLVKIERPLYNISKVVEYQLLAQNQIFFKQECRIESFDKIKNLGDKLDSQDILITCQIVFTCVLFCVMFFFSFAEVTQILKEDCNCCYPRAYVIIKELSIYLFAVTVIVSYSYMIDLVLSLEEQNSKNCFMSTAQAKLDQLYTTLNGTSLSLSYCLLIDAGLMIIIDFVMQTFLCFRKLQKRYRQGAFSQQFSRNQPVQYQQNQNQNGTPFQNGQQQPQQDIYQTTNQDINQQPYLQQTYQQVDPYTVQNNPVPQIPYIQNQQYLYHQPPQQYYIFNKYFLFFQKHIIQILNLKSNKQFYFNLKKISKP